MLGNGHTRINGSSCGALILEDWEKASKLVCSSTFTAGKYALVSNFLLGSPGYAQSEEMPAWP